MNSQQTTTILKQYNSLVKQIRVLRISKQWESLPSDKKKFLLTAIRALLNKIKSLIPKLEFKKILASAALITGFSFTSSAQFAAPITNPFGFSFIDSLVVPTLADMDNDGDKDLFVGNRSGDIFYLPNTGTVSAPIFGAPQTNPFGLTNVGSGYATMPSLADMDNDGDMDMWVGDAYGDILYFQNTGTASSPAFAPAVNLPFGLTGVNYAATPHAADMDNDGDLDLIVGDYYGDITYFQNTGSASAPAFGAAQVLPFGLTNVGFLAAPAAADLDNDGDLDLFVTEYYGNVVYFQNIGTAAVPSFGAATLNPFGISVVGYYAAPAFADMDNDGDLDLFIGELYGTLNYFQNMGGIGITEQNTRSGFSLFPNPATNQITIHTNNIENGFTVVLTTSSGQKVKHLEITNANQVVVNLDDLPAGLYITTITSANGVSVYRLIKA